MSVVTDNLKHSLTEVLVGAAKTPWDIYFRYLGNRIIHPPPSEEQYSLQLLRTTKPGNIKDLHFSILAASTKTVRSVHWLFIQNRMYQLLHLSRKFSLLLLCSIGSEAYPAELKDGRFWSSRAKSFEIWGCNIPLSQPTIHSVPIRSTPRMTWREELNCDYNLRHTSSVL
jgi:hypothetical protein